MFKRFIAQAPLPIVQAGMGFASVSVYSRLFDASAYGVYAVLLSASLLAHTLLFTWIEACAYRFQPPAKTEHDADHFAFLRNAALVACAAACFAALVAVLAFPQHGLAIACAALALSLRFLSRIAREGERAGGRVTRFVGREIAFHALSLPLGALILWSSSLGLAAPFLGMAAAAAIFAIDDATTLWRGAQGGRTRRADIVAYMHYGAPLALALGFDLFNQATLRALTLSAAAPAEAGAFAAAASLARPIDLVCAAIGLAYGPLLLEASAKAARRDLAHTRRVALVAMLALGGGAALTLSLVAAPLSQLALGEGLRARAADTLPWLAAAAFFSGMALHYLSEALIVARRTYARAACLAAAALLQFALAWKLVPLFGATGAAAAAAAGAVAACALLAIAARTRTQTEARHAPA